MNIARQYNFLAIHNRGCDIMIRGHDHVQGYIECAKRNGEIKPKVHYDEWWFFQVVLKRNKMYVINPGALCDRKYAILDTGKDDSGTYLTVEFKKF